MVTMLFVIIGSFLLFRVMQEVSYIQREPVVIQHADDTWHFLREIVREEYDSFTRELNTMLMLFGLLITFLAVVVPIMIQRERIRELDKAIEKSEELSKELASTKEELNGINELALSLARSQLQLTGDVHQKLSETTDDPSQKIVSSIVSFMSAAFQEITNEFPNMNEEQQAETQKALKDIGVDFEKIKQIAQKGE